MSVNHDFTLYAEIYVDATRRNGVSCAAQMNFYVTFGQKYFHQPHPSGLKVHPDGWFRIVASDEDKARDLAFKKLGPSWSMLYSEGDFSREHYPLGELTVLLEE